MATKAEYEAVYGPVPKGKTPATEWGDGGCWTIYTGQHYTEVIGRWSDHGEAQRVVDKLRKARLRTYQLEASHHMVGNLNGGPQKCSLCGQTSQDHRGMALQNTNGYMWP